jgi:hypothetical protein
MGGALLDTLWFGFCTINTRLIFFFELDDFNDNSIALQYFHDNACVNDWKNRPLGLTKDCTPQKTTPAKLGYKCPFCPTRVIP